MAWFSPNADCSCSACNFSAGWTYGANCTLTFGVGNIVDNCAYSNDITPTITITGPGTIPPVVEYDFFGRTHYRVSIWKPTAGATYTATVSITCTDSTVVSRTYSFTVPTPANLGCFCCNTRIPDYLTITGLSGVAAYANGTYALVNPGSGQCGFVSMSPCFSDVNFVTWCEYCPTAQPAFEPEPSGTICSTSNPNLLANFFLGSDQIFVYKGGVSIAVGLAAPSSIGDTSTLELIVYIAYLYRTYRLRNGVCDNGTTQLRQGWFFTSRCEENGLTLSCEVDFYSGRVPSVGPPTPNLFFQS